MNSVTRLAAKIKELGLLQEQRDTKQEDKQHMKAKLAQALKKKWENKVMHGQYLRGTDRQLICEEDTFLWLTNGDLKAETESEIVAAQDQALHTKYYDKKILKTETDSKCRLCQQFDETAAHIITACPILAREQYIERHDRVCAQIHYNICKEMGVRVEKKQWYEYVPNSVEKTQGVR